MKDSTDRDSLDRRCPRLGSAVTFGYCRTTGEGGLPCFKVFDCWWERFDVVAHMKALLSEEEFKKVAAAKPKPKVGSLIELIEQAKKRAAGED